MNKAEIIEGNKLIAEFLMGFEYERSVPGHGGIIIKTLGIEDCRYHSSWDWLMPVVEKINLLGYRTIISGGDEYFLVYMNIMTGISVLESSLDSPSKFLGLGESKINNVYSAVTQFIKWYNQQLANHNSVK